MTDSEAEDMREAARMVAAIDADLNKASNKSSALKMEEILQHRPRDIVAAEARLKEINNKIPADTMNPTEQDRRLEIRKLLCRAHNATRPRNLFETLVVDRITECPLTGKHMSVKEACALIKEQWMKEGIWDPQWSKHGIPFGPWKEMEYMHPPGFWELATMKRHPIPDGPFDRFQTHLIKLRYSIQNENGEMPSEDALATRVRMAWKYWNIWNRNWGAVPGREADWNHEIPLETWLKDEMGDEYIYDPDTAVETCYEPPLPAWLALAKKDPSNAAASPSTLPSLPLIELDSSGEPLYGIDRVTKANTGGVNRAAFGRRQGPSIFGSTDSPYQFNRIRLPNWEGWPLYECCLKRSPQRSSSSPGAKPLASGQCIHHTSYDPNAATAYYARGMSSTPRRVTESLNFSGLISPYMDWAAAATKEGVVGNPAIWAMEGRRAATRRRLAQQDADKNRGDPVRDSKKAPIESHWQPGLPRLNQHDIGELPPTVAVSNFQPYGTISAERLAAQQWLQPYIDQQPAALQGESYPRCQRARRQYRLNNLTTGPNCFQPPTSTTSPMTTQPTIPPLNTRPASLVNTDFHQRAAQDDKRKLPPRTRFMHTYPANLNPRATAFHAPAQPSDPVLKSEKKCPCKDHYRERAVDIRESLREVQDCIGELKSYLADKDKAKRAPVLKTTLTTIRVHGGPATVDIGGKINPKTAKAVNLAREGIMLVWSRSADNPDDVSMCIKISRPQVPGEQGNGVGEKRAPGGTAGQGDATDRPGVTKEKVTVHNIGAALRDHTAEKKGSDDTADGAAIDEKQTTDEKSTTDEKGATDGKGTTDEPGVTDEPITTDKKVNVELADDWDMVQGADE